MRHRRSLVRLGIEQMRSLRPSNNRLSYAIALCLSLFLFPAAGAHAGEQLTIMTYNIRIGAGTGDIPKRAVRDLRFGSEKLQPIIEAIRAVGPNIVGLQEVHGKGQARRLAKALNMHFTFAWHLSRKPWWGVAILSKFKISNARGAEISTGRGNHKTMAIAELDVEGRTVTAICVHKDKDLDDGESFRILMGEVSLIKGPVILMGDFNVDPDDSRLAEIKSLFVDTATVVNTRNADAVRELGTFFTSGRRIDYIFISPRQFKALDAGLMPYEYWDASDHIGYYARVSFLH